MDEDRSEETWWRCAYAAYLGSELRIERMDETEARRRAATSLWDTVEGFLEGKWNFGTLKYRMDQASVESGHAFPPRTVSSTLTSLALGVPLDDLEPGLRRTGALPEDPGAAKGSLMDLEGIMEKAVSSGSLDRGEAAQAGWVEMAACLWHIQDPYAWPMVSRKAMCLLRSRGEVSNLEPAHDYAEYASSMLRIAEHAGADMIEMEHLLEALADGSIEVPGPEECFRESMQRAEEHASQGRTDEALEWFERSLSIRPRTPAALLRKAELYESRGLVMAAIGELEALMELEPGDREGHRRLVALYRSQDMVREHNLEVRRWKALKGAKEQRP